MCYSFDFPFVWSRAREHYNNDGIDNLFPIITTSLDVVDKPNNQWSVAISFFFFLCVRVYVLSFPYVQLKHMGIKKGRKKTRKRMFELNHIKSKKKWGRESTCHMIDIKIRKAHQSTADSVWIKLMLINISRRRICFHLHIWKFIILSFFAQSAAFMLTMVVKKIYSLKFNEPDVYQCFSECSRLLHFISIERNRQWILSTWKISIPSYDCIL